MAVPKHVSFSPSYFSCLSINLLFVYFSTGILRHLTVVRTSSLFGHVTRPTPVPVNIEKLQEEAQKVSGKEVVNFLFLLIFVCVCVVNLVY